MAQEYMGYDEFSKDYNINKGTLYGWVCRKLVPHIRIGKRTVRFSRKEIEQWMREKAVPSREPKQVAR